MHRKNLTLKEKKKSAKMAITILEQKRIEPTMRRIARLMHYAPSTAMMNLLWDMVDDGDLFADVFQHGKGVCSTRTVFGLRKGAKDDRETGVRSVFI